VECLVDRGIRLWVHGGIQGLEKSGQITVLVVAIFVFDVEGYLLSGVVRTVIQFEDVALLGLIFFGGLLSGRTEFDIPAVRLRHLTLLSVETTNVWIRKRIAPKTGD
jgi:hypothetical protein